MPQLTIPTSPQFATTHRVSSRAGHVETTEERELREIREARERKAAERRAKEEQQQLQQQKQKFVEKRKMDEESEEEGRDIDFVVPEVHEGQETKEEQEGEDDGGNGFFFTVPASSRPVVERKFNFASDRRAADRKRRNKDTVGSTSSKAKEFVPFAEALHKVQAEERIRKVDSEEDNDIRKVIVIAPPPSAPPAPPALTIPKTPKFATTARARTRVVEKVANEDNMSLSEALQAKQQQMKQKYQQQQQHHVQQPELTVPKTPNFATAHRARGGKGARAEEEDDSLVKDDNNNKATKKFRSTAATRAAMDGGAVGVPLIPKAALTRPEEFDFATAARALAMEGGKSSKAQPDIFEQAAAEVRSTANKMGIYVDLDGNLDQATTVAKNATTGKKRRLGQSRVFGFDQSDLVQPDFGDESLLAFGGGAAAFDEQQQQQPQKGQHLKKHRDERSAAPAAPPALTIPKTPKFATAQRAKSKPAPTATFHSEEERKPFQAVKHAAPQQDRAPLTLTVPETPKFATDHRLRGARTEQHHAAAEVPRSTKPAFVSAPAPPAAAAAARIELTEPKPFSFATDARAKAPRAVVPSAAPKQHQHDHQEPAYADRYSTALRLTEPQPFSFATDNRLGDAVVRRTRVENDHPNAASASAPSRPPTTLGLTEPQPFKLHVDVRGAVSREVLERKIQEEENARQRKTQVQYYKPYVAPDYEPPQPVARLPVTQAHEFVLNSDVRAAKRREFEEAERERRAEEKRMAMEREAERVRREQEEIRELRKQMVPKARPIMMHDPNPIVQKRNDNFKLTEPKSPNFATSKRFNRVM